jgi:hypothetical protein
MRLSRLLAALAVTAMAFALFGANARAATQNLGTVGSTAQPYGPITVTGMVPVPDLTAALCPGEGFDFCGHVFFTAGLTGIATITGSFTASEGEPDLVLCGPQLATEIVPDRCANGTEIPCGKTEIVNPSTDTGTITLSCQVTGGTQYELLIVPVLCDFGCTVSGSIVINGAGGGGTGGIGATNGFVTGGGKVNVGTQVFSITAFADAAKSDQGHALIKIPGAGGGQGCSIRAIFFQTFVFRQSNHVVVTGRGYVNGNGNDQIDFQADILDNGEGSNKSDTFQLTSNRAGCSTGDPNVTNGNTQIHPNT